jgi:type I restriction enzyme R subunit
MAPLNEDTLVQATTADYLEDQLGWDSIYAYNNETYGAEGTLGRQSDKDVVLTRYLGEALVNLNPGLPDAAYHDALRQITEAPVTENTLQINFEQYELVKNGVLVQFRNARGELERKRLKISISKIPKIITSSAFGSCGCVAIFTADAPTLLVL